MKHILQGLASALLILSEPVITHAQAFNRGSLSAISTNQVIPENYSSVRLDPEQVADPKANIFDISNADTHLQVLIDNAGRKYHILLQTNFTGRVTFLSISNNLATTFSKKDKPMLMFNDCIQDLNTSIIQKQNIEIVIKCVIERLEYCSR
jgi:hypothetical protein